MAVELGASRLLAPYFSSSQIVWTIIIGTIMIAMALGNIYGGKSADKSPDLRKLYGRILIAAIWIALIPVVGKYIVLGISALLIFTVNNNFLIIATFVACMVIFVFPLFLLGTVTPSLAKYFVDSLEDSGKTVGTPGAFNTIGSYARHDPSSPFLIGNYMPDDKVHKAEQKSWIDGQKTLDDFTFKLLSYPKKTFTRAQLMDEFWGLESNTTLT